MMRRDGAIRSYNAAATGARGAATSLDLRGKLGHIFADTD
jgi:hypothetical protein